jgi:hypothetical protein
MDGKFIDEFDYTPIMDWNEIQEDFCRILPKYNTKHFVKIVKQKEKDLIFIVSEAHDNKGTSLSFDIAHKPMRDELIKYVQIKYFKNKDFPRYIWVTHLATVRIVEKNFILRKYQELYQVVELNETFAKVAIPVKTRTHRFYYSLQKLNSYFRRNERFLFYEFFSRAPNDKESICVDVSINKTPIDIWAFCSENGYKKYDLARAPSRFIPKSFDEIHKDAQNGEQLDQFYLASMYYFGENVERNLMEAIKWYKKATDHHTPYVRALYELACIYYYGDLGKPDYSEAQKWLIAAKKWLPSAKSCETGSDDDFLSNFEKELVIELFKKTNELIIIVRPVGATN